MEINRLAWCAFNTNSHGGGSFRPIVYKQRLNSFQLKQKHHQVHPRSHPKLKHSKVHRKPTLKPPASYLVPNPKFHYSTEKSSANNSATISVELENHQSQSSTLNPVYEYSEEINAQAERDFNERRRHLWEVCERSKIVGKFSPNAWEFLISPGHGLAWCNVFKAASSTWMYYFNLLGKSRKCIWFEWLLTQISSWLRRKISSKNNRDPFGAGAKKIPAAKYRRLKWGAWQRYNLSGRSWAIRAPAFSVPQ